MTTHSSELAPPQEKQTAGVPARLWRFIRGHGWKEADLKQEVIVSPEGDIITPQRQKLLTRIGQEDEKQQARGSKLLMLYGPPGTGKTSIVKEYARTAEKVYVELSCHGGITQDDFAEIAEGIQIPGTVIFLDEFNTLPSNIREWLHPLLDGRRELHYKGETIKVAEDVFIIGAMNAAKDRSGVDELDKASRSRSKFLRIGYPHITDVDGTLHADEVLMAKQNLSLFPDYNPNEFLVIWNQLFNKGKGKPDITQEEETQLRNIREILLIAEKLRTEYKKHSNGQVNNLDVVISQPFTTRDIIDAIQELMYEGHPINVEEHEARQGMTIAKKAMMSWIDNIRAEDEPTAYYLRKMILDMEIE